MGIRRARHGRASASGHATASTFEGCRHFPASVHGNIKDAVPGVVSIAAWSMIVGAIDAVLYAAPEAAGISVVPGLKRCAAFQAGVNSRPHVDAVDDADGPASHPRQIVKTIGGHQPGFRCRATLRGRT
jgi:hypothetical protein